MEENAYHTEFNTKTQVWHYHLGAQQQEDEELCTYFETYRRHDMLSLKKDFVAPTKGKQGFTFLILSNNAFGKSLC
jgi:hypothetical protein